MDKLIEATAVTVRYHRKTAVDRLDFSVGRGRVVGLLGHNGAGKTSLLKAMAGLLPFDGQLSLLGFDPRRQRVELLESLSYIPDVAILPRWARVGELITLMTGLHPRFSAERARTLLRRTSVGLHDRVKTLSKGMVVQVHLALIAAIDARVMLLDEPTLGLDILTRKAFYEMLVEEWCDGERSLLISTHQVEEIQPLLSDVLMLNEGRLVLSTSLVELDQRFVGLSHDAAASDEIAAAHPLLRFRQMGQSAALFDGPPPPHIAALGRRFQPSLVDLFVALTRAPEMNRSGQSAG